MRGNLDLTIGPAGFTGDLSGFVDGLRAFSAEGKGQVDVEGMGLGGGGTRAESVGAAACGDGPFGLSAGFGTRWDEFPKPKIMAGSCGIGEWGVAPPAASQAGSRQLLGAARHTRQLTVSAVGSVAAPAVTLRSPGGVTLSAPPTGAVLEGGRLAFRYDGDATAYLAVARPRAGRWTLSADPGSAPVARFRRAGDLDPVRVRARVSGRGGACGACAGASAGGPECGSSSWNAAAPPCAVIAVSRGGRGSARFRPAVAPGLPRRVVALVARAGLPESKQTVARFRARTLEPGRPARVTIRRRGGGVVIRWTRARRSTGHLVRVRVSDGRTLLFQPRRRPPPSGSVKWPVATGRS